MLWSIIKLHIIISVACYFFIALCMNFFDKKIEENGWIKEEVEVEPDSTGCVKAFFEVIGLSVMPLANVAIMCATFVMCLKSKDDMVRLFGDKLLDFIN